ncbi:MAG TPA: glycosyltransferase [Vicinamibacterales bacterium]|nr:glycosyltransferase [Vicinamibacterales bacterium]
MAASITAGITTRNRPDSLRACVEALSNPAVPLSEILIFDDASDPPVTSVASARAPVRVFRASVPCGPTEGRNRIVEEAHTPYVLLLDDDARLLRGDAVERACAVLDADRLVAAVAFAQAEADGQPWPASMQPSPAGHPVRVRAFIGFAHLVRRDVFRALGGYRTLLGFYGEEKELCLRVLDAGYSVVYLPDARVAHVLDRAGRDRRRYLRAVSRNDCLNTLLNEPWTRVAWMLPGRLALYFQMRRAWQVRDPGGFLWLLAEMWRARAAIRRERRAVSRATIRRWRELGAHGEPYLAP